MKFSVASKYLKFKNAPQNMPHFLFLFVTAGRGDMCYYDQNIHLVKKTIKDLTFNGA